MKISSLIAELTRIQEQHGDIEVNLQEENTNLFPDFFIVPEQYEEKDGGWAVNLRNWPY